MKLPILGIEVSGLLDGEGRIYHVRINREAEVEHEGLEVLLLLGRRGLIGLGIDELATVGIDAERAENVNHVIVEQVEDELTVFLRKIVLALGLHRAERLGAFVGSLGSERIAKNSL